MVAFLLSIFLVGVYQNYELDNYKQNHNNVFNRVNNGFHLNGVIQMISTTLTKNITNITELKKNPVELSKHSETCVLSNGRPCFYALSAERMAELLEIEKSHSDALNKLNTCEDWIYSTYQAMSEGNLKKANEYMQRIGKTINKIQFDPKEDEE